MINDKIILNIVKCICRFAKACIDCRNAIKWPYRFYLRDDSQLKYKRFDNFQVFEENMA